MKLRKILAVTAVAATMTAAFAVNAMAEETLKLYEGEDFTYDAEKGIITLTTNKQHTTADPYTMLVVVNDEKPLEDSSIPSDTSFDDTDIKQIDQADAKFEKINVGTLAEGTYEIRLGGDGQVRWGTLEVKAPDDDKPYTDGERLIGDVNGLDAIGGDDANLIFYKTVDLATITGDAFWAADINEDGYVTGDDANLILYYTVELTNPYLNVGSEKKISERAKFDNNEE